MILEINMIPNICHSKEGEYKMTKEEELLFYKKHYDIHKPMKYKSSLFKIIPFHIEEEVTKWRYPFRVDPKYTLRWGHEITKINIKPEFISGDANG